VICIRATRQIAGLDTETGKSFEGVSLDNADAVIDGIRVTELTVLWRSVYQAASMSAETLHQSNLIQQTSPP
jgi:hypothetical protein